MFHFSWFIPIIIFNQLYELMAFACLAAFIFVIIENAYEFVSGEFLSQNNTDGNS